MLFHPELLGQKPTPENRSRTPEFPSHHPNEERPEISTPQKNLPLESMLLWKELEKSQQMKLWLYHPFCHTK